MKKKIRLSQCMIVKNEEANIEKALSWGKEIAYEQIVVDTGSTDRTVELAKAMGAKVYFFEWIDDFAAAKNFAISKAGGNWIAFLDADETFAEGDGQKLLSILEKNESSKNPADVIWATRWEVMDDGIRGGLSIPRIFRNDPKLRYHRRIHEYPAWSEEGRTLKFLDATESLSILHTGYQKKEMQKKEMRNQKLILKELEENPNDSEMWGYLGDEYYGADKYEEAVGAYEKAIDLMPKRCASFNQRSAFTFTKLMSLFLNEKNDPDAVERVYQIAVDSMPKEPDFELFYGISLEKQGRFAECREHLELALKKLEQNPISGSIATQGNLQRIYHIIAWCSLKLGDSNKAVEYCVQLLKADPTDRESLKLLLIAFRGTGFAPVVTPEQTVNFLTKLCDLTNLHMRCILFLAAKAAPYPELVNYMEQTMFTPEEKEEMEKVGI